MKQFKLIAIFVFCVVPICFLYLRNGKGPADSSVSTLPSGGPESSSLRQSAPAAAEDASIPTPIANSVSTSTPKSSTASGAITEKAETTHKDPELTGVKTKPTSEATLLKNGKGKPLSRYQEEASNECGKSGMRMPTIRELAQQAAAHGAKGIVGAPEGDGATEGTPPKHIVATNPDGSVDDFYYDPTGFTPDQDPKNIPVASGPTGTPLQGHWVWSSSTSNCELGDGASFCAYVFDASDGHISGKYNNMKLAVTCIPP